VVDQFEIVPDPCLTTSSCMGVARERRLRLIMTVLMLFWDTNSIIFLLDNIIPRTLHKSSVLCKLDWEHLRHDLDLVYVYQR
jgi:hypothetical protein